MTSGYNPKDIEKKWQDAWEEYGIYRATDDAKVEPFYGLIEFPYPSGEGLHVGHPRSYVAIDIMTRKKRMEGKNVLYPIGWDAFGLPTENFAIKHKMKPQDATAKNIANFTRQIKSLGIGFDWSREINTTDPTYYKWTQWMFLQFYGSWYDAAEQRARPIEELPIPSDVESKGDAAVAAYRDRYRLAYKATTTINWCPNDKIGLANEEAQGGVCERCGGKVEKREKAQWMIRITAYAERLIQDLETVDYLEKIKAQQINWIGKSEGAEVTFALSGIEGQEDGKYSVSVFTTRPDTMFGATFLVISPELAKKWMDLGWKASSEVASYVESAMLRTDMERQTEGKTKTGVATGIMALNPATNEQIPVWIADYVLGGYGTGAIMAVPAHDERDAEFAKTFALPVKQVVAPYLRMTGIAEPREDKETTRRNVVTAIVKHVSKDEYLLLVQKDGQCGLVGGGIEKGETFEEAIRREIAEETGYTNSEIKETILSIYGHGYKPRKDVSCFDADTVFLAEVSDKERIALSEEDQGAHEVVWVSAEDVGRRLTKDHHRFVWEWYREHKSTYVGEGIATNSGFLDGLSTADAKKKMVEWLQANKVGGAKTTYKLRDWVFSRQRYWGEPIPMIQCASCGMIPVHETELPVVLPDVEAYQPTDTGESPLAAMDAWVNVTCPSCGGDAKRETDTMPNWAGSSWYFLRYSDPKNDAAFASPEKLSYWMPVDLYNGGMEHTTLHLLYSRFWYKFLWDRGFVPQECGSEPYAKRRSHALILGEGGVKMSKSKGNVVNPDDVVGAYGADVFRMYEMFIGPFDQDAPWDTNGIEGIKRFLEGVWTMFNGCIDAGYVSDHPMSEDLEVLLHKTIKKVGDDIENMKFNTSVSAMMILMNGMAGDVVPEEHQWSADPTRKSTTLTSEIAGKATLNRFAAETFLKILAPFAPHITEELWERFGHDKSIHQTEWPSFDPSKLQSSTFTLVVQVNGKVRDRLEVSSDISEEEAVQRALASEKVQASLEGKTPAKTIYIKGRLVSVST